MFCRGQRDVPSTGSSSTATSGPATSGGDPVGETVPSAPSPHLAKPETLLGDCRAFLTQCELHFELQAAAYPTDRAKVAFVISHLTGRAESWATAEWSRKSVVCDSYANFTQTFTQIFQIFTPGREAARALVGLQQGRRGVSDYAVEFRILAAESGWNSSALCDAFLHGLSHIVKDQLISLDLPADLDALVARTVKIDKRLLERA